MISFHREIQSILDLLATAPVTDVYSYKSITFQHNFSINEFLVTKNILNEFVFIFHKNTPSNNLHERVAESNGVFQQLDFETFYGVFMDQLYGLQLPDELSQRLEAKRALEFAAEIVACWCTPLDRSVSLLNDTGLYSKPNKKAQFVKACDYAFCSWHTLQDNWHQLYMVMAGHYARESFVDVMDTPEQYSKFS